ncbi:MAG TPA: sigma 54-interacting transcriptional regulator [Polyangia bacterium]|nr:sigma 54-interacting transcriptional regulator [Polyangia bacterium]
MAVLLALFGPKRGVRLEIEKQATLGRSSDADLQLVDGKVSRLHCRFTIQRGKLEVEDLGSHNGTFVNGERLASPRPLAAGDEVAVGDSLFLVDGGADAAAARFGDATLIVTPGGPPAETARPGAAPAPESGRLAAASALAVELAGCRDLEAAARAVLAAMEKALAPKRGFVLLWDRAQSLARPLVGRSDDATVSISRTVLELAAQRRRAVAVEDAVEDRALKQARSVVRNQLRAVAVAPVIVAGEVTGFLHVDRERPHYAADDAALLDCFAAAFALAGHLGAPAAAAPAGARPGDRAPADAPIGVSKSWRAALRVADASAAASSTVLITGESGTGKEEIAAYVHRRSARAGGPFVAVNCGAIAETLAESELFGHEKGAFTGSTASRTGSIEAADGGTLFLDEVGELSAAIQVKLLRVLQERVFCRVGSTIPRRVDVRFVAATHRELEADVRAGRFREDLFYRLAVIRIKIPPLRERPEDIEPLARALMARTAAALGRREVGITDEALEALGRWRWPGNVRELANLIERALVLRPPETTGPITADEVAASLDEPPREAAAAAASGTTLASKVDALERTEIETALRRARGVKARAAQALGLSRPTLDKKMADLAIDVWKK